MLLKLFVQLDISYLIMLAKLVHLTVNLASVLQLALIAMMVCISHQVYVKDAVKDVINALVLQLAHQHQLVA